MSNLEDKLNSVVVLVTNHDDWEALYINGKAVIQEHKIQRSDLVRYCLEYNTMYCEVSASYEELEMSGRYPDNLNDIPEYDDITLKDSV